MESAHDNDEIRKPGDMSNKSLATLLMFAVIVSLVGLGSMLVSMSRLTRVEVTGLAPGFVNLTITNSTGCSLESNVSFGSGYPNQTITLNTSADSITGFDNCSSTPGAGCYRGMQINNTGNTWLNVTMASSVNASGLTDPNANFSYFQWWVINGTKAGINPGCQGLGNLGPVGGQPVNSSNTSIVCYNLSYVGGTDVVTLGWAVTVNQTTPKTGMKNATITITCAQSSQQ